MKQIKVWISILMLASLMSVNYLSAELDENSMPPDLAFAKAYQSAEDKDFPNDGQKQIFWFYQKNFLFRVIKNEDLKTISNLGRGDMLYLTDDQLKYLHCFMIEAFDKKKNLLTIMGARKGEKYHIYSDSKGKPSLLSLAHILKMDPAWQRIYIGSKGSKYVDRKKRNDLTLSQEISPIKLKFNLPSYDWIFDRHDFTQSKINIYGYIRAGIIDSHNIEVYPYIGMVTEQVPADLDLILYSTSKRIEMTEKTGKKFKVSKVFTHEDSDLKLKNAIGFEGTYVQNEIEHSILMIVGITKNQGFTLVMDTTSELKPKVFPEFSKLISSMRIQ